MSISGFSFPAAAADIVTTDMDAEALYSPVKFGDLFSRKALNPSR